MLRDSLLTVGSGWAIALGVGAELGDSLGFLWLQDCGGRMCSSLTLTISVCLSLVVFGDASLSPAACVCSWP